MTRVSNKAAKAARVKEPVCCTDCFWSNLIRYGKNDPLLAECRQKPNYGNARFPYAVEVARAKRLCGMHTFQDESEKGVQVRVKVRSYLMNGQKAA